MIEQIVGLISALIFVAFGYYLGRRDRDIPKDVKRVYQTVSRALPIKKDVGAVTALTQQEIDLIENPIKRAENEEMSKTFQAIMPDAKIEE